MQECIRESDPSKKNFHLSLSEQIMAKGLVIIICGSPGNIQMPLLQIIQDWEGGEHTGLETKAHGI